MCPDGELEAAWCGTDQDTACRALSQEEAAAAAAAAAAATACLLAARSELDTVAARLEAGDPNVGSQDVCERAVASAVWCAYDVPTVLSSVCQQINDEVTAVVEQAAQLTAAHGLAACKVTQPPEVGLRPQTGAIWCAGAMPSTSTSTTANAGSSAGSSTTTAGTATATTAATATVTSSSTQACQPCQAGFYEVAPCTATQAAVCMACTVCPAGTQESAACGAGHDTMCEPCILGMSWSAAGPCVACSECGAGEYTSRECTPTSDRECRACRVCGTGEYEARPCSASADRTCAPATTATTTATTGAAVTATTTAAGATSGTGGAASVLSVVQGRGQLSEFGRLVSGTGEFATLLGDGAQVVTVFAATNAAFAAASGAHGLVGERQ